MTAASQNANHARVSAAFDEESITSLTKRDIEKLALYERAAQQQMVVGTMPMRFEVWRLGPSLADVGAIKICL